jgi:hypothetical protein
MHPFTATKYLNKVDNKWKKKEYILLSNYALHSHGLQFFSVVSFLIGIKCVVRY